MDIGVRDCVVSRVTLAAASSLFLLTAFAIHDTARAGPIVIEESAKIASPDPSYSFGRLVAIDGNDAIVTGSRPIPGQPTPELDDSAWLYQRQSNGQWTLVRRLVQSVQDPIDLSLDMTVDMRDGLAALVDYRGHVFERTANGWIEHPSGSAIGGNVGDLEIHDGTIFGTHGSSDWGGRAFRRNAAGNWVEVARVPGQSRSADDEQVGDDGDIFGSTMIVANLGDEDTGAPPEARIFEGPFGTTPRMTVIRPPLFAGGLTSYPRPVAITAMSALIGATIPSRVYAYGKDTTGAWSARGPLPNPAVIRAGHATSAELYGDLAVAGYPADPLRGTGAGAVGVFQRNPDGSYRYVARLVASDAAAGLALGNRIEISGRRIIASANNAAYIFDLPANLDQPALLQEDFENVNAVGWTTVPGSSFQILTSLGSRVYRQSSELGDAGAIVDASERRNQAIQVDVRPTSFASGAGERWFGLVARYTDPANYYYVTLRNTNVVQIKRMRNGTFVTLAEKALPIALNRTYRVRLEAVGTRLRVFVDNTFIAEARDSEHPRGKAGIFMYKTRADWDNVVISSDPHTRLVNDDFYGISHFWSTNGVGEWSILPEGSNTVVANTSLDGDARIVIGEPVADQIVQVRAKPVAFSGTDRWFGLMARYRDERNYYYITARNSNTVSLRALVNGTAVVLDTATLPITLNRWYTLRLETIGNSIRGYVDGNLVLEAKDSTHAAGTYGAVVYRAIARYDDFTAMQP